MDTGSDVFWLPRVNCVSNGVDVRSCRSGQGLYNPGLSSTARDLHTRFEITYGTGSAVGDYVSDIMSFGANENHVSVGNVTLGAATRMTFSDEGILGLSFAQSGDPTPVFELAVQRGVFKEPIFSVYLADCDEDCEDGGMIQFGGTDTQNCQNVVGSVNVVGNSPYWLFELGGVTANGQNVRNSRTQMMAITDTGTSIIAGPNTLIRQIAALLNAQQVQDTYFVACDARLQLSFLINGRDYTINEEQLVMQGTSMGMFCQLSLDGDDSLNFMILGSPFIRGFCLIHNIQEKKISFAPVRSNVTKSGSSRPTNSRPSPNNNGGGRGSPWDPSPFGGVDDSFPWGRPFGGSPWSPFGGQTPFGRSPFGQQPGFGPFEGGWGTAGGALWSSPWAFPEPGNLWFYGRFKRTSSN